MAYDYNMNEKILMSFITGISNFFSFPGLILMYLYERPFEFYLGSLTMLTSFMYHVTESLDCEFYMSPGKWHQLDNVGSICLMNSLLISMMSSYRNHPKQMNLNLFSLVFVLILQIKEPWDLFNTIFPIGVYGVLLIVDIIRHGVPRYNYDIMSKGVGILLIALAMFVKGLDENSDYLRIAHSIWHILVGISTFYLWQVQERKMITFTDVFREAYHKLSGIHH